MYITLSNRESIPPHNSQTPRSAFRRKIYPQKNTKHKNYNKKKTDEIERGRKRIGEKETKKRGGRENDKQRAEREKEREREEREKERERGYRREGAREMETNRRRARNRGVKDLWTGGVSEWLRQPK